jgi:hypothetical protein
MTNNLNLNPGDIILYRSNKKLSIGKAIQFFMKRYLKKLGIEKSVVYNHSATIINLYDRLFVGEALGKGITISPFDDTYANKLDRIKIITPKKAYSKIEKEKINKVVLSYVLKPTRYDFLNFWYQIKMILNTTKKGDKDWDGPTGKKATKRMYCTEASATWANEIRQNTFKDPWSINPVDIDLNKYYKVVYNGVE